MYEQIVCTVVVVYNMQTCWRDDEDQVRCVCLSTRGSVSVNYLVRVKPDIGNISLVKHHYMSGTVHVHLAKGSQINIQMLNITKDCGFM